MSASVDIPHHILFYDEPERFIGMRGNRRNFPADLENIIIEWLEDLIQSPGRKALPTHWGPTSGRSC
ncbi:MAG: hypothetical protein OXE93_03850 [bacterium]|nr:hypothetical protein [bacterium]MCY4163335.1 hypothetical protein [bacterium]MCY4258130.1 hypothetical protein [bacterium]